MTYSEKLRDPRWQKKRLEIFQRDGFACLCCQATKKPLAVHHIVYRKVDPWDYPDYLYQTLCEDCHTLRQELTDKAVEGLRIAIKDTPSQRLERVARQLCAKALEVIGLSYPDTDSKGSTDNTHTQDSLTVNDGQRQA